MYASKRREHPRNVCESNIKYAPAEENEIVETQAYNYSSGGMYLESPEWFPANTNIRIMMKNYDPEASGPESFQSYVANIRWCREVKRNGATIYGLGVQFLERRHDLLDKPIQVEWVACELCGEFVKMKDARLNGDKVRICQDCRASLGCLPDGKLNDCVERYLSGNIF